MLLFKSGCSTLNYILFFGGRSQQWLLFNKRLFLFDNIKSNKFLASWRWCVAILVHLFIQALAVFKSNWFMCSMCLKVDTFSLEMPSGHQFLSSKIFWCNRRQSLPHWKALLDLWNWCCSLAKQNSSWGYAIVIPSKYGSRLNYSTVPLHFYIDHHKISSSLFLPK